MCCFSFVNILSPRVGCLPFPVSILQEADSHTICHQSSFDFSKADTRRRSERKNRKSGAYLSCSHPALNCISVRGCVPWRLSLCLEVPPQRLQFSLYHSFFFPAFKVRDGSNLLCLVSTRNSFISISILNLSEPDSASWQDWRTEGVTMFSNNILSWQEALWCHPYPLPKCFNTLPHLPGHGDALLMLVCAILYRYFSVWEHHTFLYKIRVSSSENQE